jgi:collagenase-like PrtC family protease
MNEIKKEFEENFTESYDNNQWKVYHWVDSQGFEMDCPYPKEVWTWIESKLQKEREEAVREFVEWLEKQTIELREVNFGYACNKITMLAEKYLSQTKGGKE